MPEGKAHEGNVAGKCARRRGRQQARRRVPAGAQVRRDRNRTQALNNEVRIPPRHRNVKRQQVRPTQVAYAAMNERRSTGEYAQVKCRVGRMQQ